MTDTIILAAGRGERLNGITPPFHKPLLLHNGVPLVRNAAVLALQAGSENVIVVAAPENAHALSSVLPEGVHIVIQRSPRGPGDAVSLGLRLVETERVLILLGDNTLTKADMDEILQEEGNAVGVSHMPVQEVERFTRLRDDVWVEKVPIAEEDVTFIQREVEYATAWVGPILVDTDHAYLWLEHWKQDAASRTGFKTEIPLGAILNTTYFKTVEVSSRDLGTPEAVK